MNKEYNTVLTSVTDSKFLGVVIDHHLNCKAHVDLVASRTKLFCLCPFFQKKSKCDKNK